MIVAPDEFSYCREIDLRPFMARSNLRAVADLVARLLGSVLFLAALHHSWGSDNLVFSFAWFVLYCIFTGFWGWAGIGHEYYHGTVFRSRRVNRALFLLSGVLTFRNPGFFAATHLRHHRDPLSESDPEGQAGGQLTGLEWLPLLAFDARAFLRSTVGLSMNVMGIVPKATSARLNLTKREIQKIVSGARVVFFAHLCIWIAFLGSGNPRIALVVTFGPFCFQALHRVLVISQHGGLEPSENLFRSTRTIILPRPLSWMYGRMNFHLEHHLAPFIPSYRLPAASEAIVKARGHDHRAHGLRELFEIAFQHREVDADAKTDRTAR